MSGKIYRFLAVGCFLFLALCVMLSCSSPNEPEEENGVVYSYNYIRDYSYIQSTYFDIGRFGRIDEDTTKWWRFVEGRDSIIDFKLFKRGSELNSNDPYAKLSIDPTDSMQFAEVLTGQYVMEMDPYEEYFYESREFWMMLERQWRTNGFLACWMRVQTSEGIIEVGSLNHDNPEAAPDTISLKLLYPGRRNDGDATWDYEWKNVYYLGARNINHADLLLDIYRGDQGNEDDEANLNHQDGVPYLQILGLDKYNENGEQDKPDGKVDYADYLLDLYRGHLCFPNRRPFDPSPAEDTAFTSNHPLGGLADRVPAIYETSNATDLAAATKYYLRIAIAQDTTQTARYVSR